MEISAVTDVGRQRKNNEDSYFVYRNDKLSGAMVADGMGGHNAGEVASAMATDLIKNCIISRYNPKMDYMEMAELIRTAFNIANNKIFEKAKNKDNVGMGTTATLAFVYDSKLIIAHIGDSRCYKITDDEICQLTNDHSYVGELMRSGVITESDARIHPNRNMITRAMGTEPGVRVDMDILPYNGETIVLCSDGLSNMLSDEQIKNLINTNDDLDYALELMIELANKKGGNDNITVAAIRN